jgi:hypothetical protein
MKIRRIFDNIEIKLVCLLLSIVIWLYANRPLGTNAIDRAISAISQGDQARIKFHEVPIEIAGIDSEWEAEPGKVSMDIDCLTSEVQMSNFKAKVKINEEDEADRQVILTKNNVELPEGLVFVRAEPNKIQLKQ